ncbi:MAG: aspartate kinase [Prevotellaceae bacterium]|jgi:aspartate kinase|nr:aspartate kinase [Prevotellaceae bacterium]
MLVYKFGGASLDAPEKLDNLSRIVARCSEKLIIAVSATGKTTNALEEVNEAYAERDTDKALRLLAEVERQHLELAASSGLGSGLGSDTGSDTGSDCPIDELKALVGETATFIRENKVRDFDFCYGRIVALGELLSSVIVNAHLNRAGLFSRLVDARGFMATDSIFREAKVYLDKTEKNIRETFPFADTDRYLTQGFIGANPRGDVTTLGREGSDYSAAIIASSLDAESLTIWKDVPGVLNADPKLFPDAEPLPELSYKDAAELSYYGARVIHPKTIQPLAGKNIPLFVRSFVEPELPGTRISHGKSLPDIHVIAVKPNQILVSVLPKDFSFASERAVDELLAVMHAFQLKIHLIQSSPLCISLCTDDGRNARLAIDELRMNGLVLYNDGLELITIRNYTDELIGRYTGSREKLILQCDRTIARILVKG